MAALVDAFVKSRVGSSGGGCKFEVAICDLKLTTSLL